MKDQSITAMIYHHNHYLKVDGTQRMNANSVKTIYLHAMEDQISKQNKDLWGFKSILIYLLDVMKSMEKTIVFQIIYAKRDTMVFYASSVKWTISRILKARAPDVAI